MMIPMFFRKFALLLLVALVCLPAAVQAQEPASNVQVTQVDTSRYPEVTLFVSVTDASGSPQTGLNRSDFAVTEDGRQVEIEEFTGSGNVPIHTAMVIDRSGSMSEDDKLEGAKDAARTFVSQMRQEDQTSLIVFNTTIHTLYQLTSDTSLLDTAIRGLLPEGGTALYDSMVAGVDELKETSGRRVLLLLTDGQDCREPGACSYMYNGSTYSLDEAIDYATTHEQPVHVIGLGDRGAFDNGIDEEVLKRIANKTGGEYFYAPDASQLVQLYNNLSGSFHDEYALTYTSPRPFYDGTHRDIVVHVGDVASAGGYTEHHLINVQSSFLVGVLLLLLLLGLLAVPSLLPALLTQRPGGPSEHKQTAHPSATSVPIYETTGNVSTTGSGESATYSEQADVCQACGKPLRAGARFCGHCGQERNPR